MTGADESGLTAHQAGTAHGVKVCDRCPFWQEDPQGIAAYCGLVSRLYGRAIDTTKAPDPPPRRCPLRDGGVTFYLDLER